MMGSDIGALQALAALIDPGIDLRLDPAYAVHAEGYRARE
jgi:hypothetical protein